MTVSPENVLNFWFSEDIEQDFKTKWFPKSTVDEMDAEIKEKYFDILKKAENKELDAWKKSPKSFLALIIVLDQFSRHIYRHSGGQEKLSNDKIALVYCEEFLALGWDNCLNVEETIFSIMPLRHSATIERLNRVLKITEGLIGLTNSRGNLINKFRDATQRRLCDLEGQAAYTGDILEFHEFSADETHIQKHKLFKTVDAFFELHNVWNYKYMMISLSGGVDSMVLTKITKILASKYDYKVVCIHIDYDNRPESGAEANFVEDWSTRLGCLFKKTVIENYTRGITPRDEYEKMSRNIRYHLYKKTLEEFENNCPAIMVGHHKGDVQENVISNMMKGCSLLDLSGMGDVSIVNGVKVWRPMLAWNKDVIFDFAHTYGVPYFKDTTPRWSNRGKLRNNLLPCLQDIYGQGVGNNLSNIAQDSMDLHELTSKQIFDPFWNSVTQTPFGIYFDGSPYLSYPLYFWKEALKHVCHSMLGVGMISDKPIKILLEKFISTKPNKNGWLSMKKEYLTYLLDSSLIIFRPQFTFGPITFEKGDPIVLGDKVEVSCFGDWKIKLYKAEDGFCYNSLPPAQSLLDIMTGSLKYSLPVMDKYIIDPLSPPKHYRRIDKKICPVIPFVTYVGHVKRPDLQPQVIVELLYDGKPEN